MRRIHMWNISGQVRENIAARKSSVKIGAFCDPHVLTTITVGKDHNHLEPGHYVVIDHAEEGQPVYVSLRITPALATYAYNSSVKARFIGAVSDVNDAVPCMIFHLTDGRADEEKPLSWREQDASNS